MTPTGRRRLGNFGEAYARRYLEARGYRFVAANWRCPSGELDLVMRDGDEVVFVEVKTRRGEGLGRAEESVSPAQVRRLLAAADHFFAETPDLPEAVWRIDLIAITLAADGTIHRCTHVVNALAAG